MPVSIHMGKQFAFPTVPKKARRVNIPAGQNYITVKPGEVVYLVEPDGVYPSHLQEIIDKREQTAYEKGLQEGSESKDRNMRQYTLEEALQHILATMRQYSAKDQNQIVAVVMSEMNKAYQARIKALAADIAHHQGLLDETEKVAAGFEAIKNGGFEKLNFS